MKFFCFNCNCEWEEEITKVENKKCKFCGVYPVLSGEQNISYVKKVLEEKEELLKNGKTSISS